MIRTTIFTIASFALAAPALAGDSGDVQKPNGKQNVIVINQPGPQCNKQCARPIYADSVHTRIEWHSLHRQELVTMDDIARCFPFRGEVAGICQGLQILCRLKQGRRNCFFLALAKIARGTEQRRTTTRERSRPVYATTTSQPRAKKRARWQYSRFSLDHLTPNDHRWSKGWWRRLRSTQEKCTPWGAFGNKNEKRCCRGGNNRSYKGRQATGNRDRKCWGIKRHRATS